MTALALFIVRIFQRWLATSLRDETRCSDTFPSRTLMCDFLTSTGFRTPGPLDNVRRAITIGDRASELTKPGTAALLDRIDLDDRSVRGWPG
jgi:hypothetical protein